MIWVALTLHVFAAFGVAYVAGYSKITLAVRDQLAQLGTVGKWIVALLECPACLGFWFGFFGAIVAPAGEGLSLQSITPWHLGFFTCGTNFLLARASGLIQDEGDSQ